MTLTIDLKPELEAQLQEESVKKDCDANTLVVEALEALFQLKNHDRTLKSLSHEESVLLQKINHGLPETVWQEYHDMIAKRRAETLTPADQVRLITLSDSISEAHAERLAHAAELARLRQMPLETLMKQLEISPREV